jgi:Peptidase family S41
MLVERSSRAVGHERTASAGEMVSAFAEENGLATIVGTTTPGRLLSGSAYEVGHGNILGLPFDGRAGREEIIFTSMHAGMPSSRASALRVAGSC